MHFLPNRCRRVTLSVPSFIHYSLIEIAEANGIDLGQWLLNVLHELPKRKGARSQDVKGLLPINSAELL
jgi:hypothetical protein